MKWEYKTVQIKTERLSGSNFNSTEFDKYLNQFGEMGWELISTNGIVTYQFGEYPYTKEIILFFKRPLER